ncbi:hypothetical protein PAXRUDRAFT_836020, partial [Paxillus rubicundulus Ve08.2h10]
MPAFSHKPRILYPRICAIPPQRFVSFVTPNLQIPESRSHFLDSPSNLNIRR